MFNGFDTIVFRNTPYPLQFIFEGQAFRIQHYFNLADATIDHHRLITGDKILHHVRTFLSWQGNNAGPLIMEVFKDSTWTDNGSAQPDVFSNLDHRSSKVADAGYTTDPTIDTDGERRVLQTIVGGENKTGSIVPDPYESVFAPNTEYSIKFDNQTGATADIFLDMLFYESGN